MYAKESFMERIYRRGILYILKYLILIGIIVGFLYLNRGNRIFSIQNLLNYSPSNPFFATIFFLILYLIKPILFVIPVPILQIVVGMVFPPLLALGINLIGLVIACTVAYGIGSILGKNRVEALLNKFEKGEELKKNRQQNEGFFVFIIRSIGLVSMDITGMFFGSVQTPFIKYIISSTLGLMPSMLIATFIGHTADDPSSPSFILSLIVKIILVITSLKYYKYKYKNTSET